MNERFPGAILRAYGELAPRIDASAWIAPGVSIVGDVEIGPESSVFYGSVLRGDVHHIRVGARTNLQDQATVHVTTDRFATILGDEITVGHRAVVHADGVVEVVDLRCAFLDQRAGALRVAVDHVAILRAVEIERR